MMDQRTGFLGAGVFRAGMTAGPLFLACLAAAYLYGEIPAPVVIKGETLGIFLILMIPATVVGAIIGLPACALGGSLMRLLADHVTAMRHPLMWLAVGGLIGAGMTWQMEAAREAVFATTITSALSALMCRRSIGWDD